jgi:hypothetical protein
VYLNLYNLHNNGLQQMNIGVHVVEKSYEMRFHAQNYWVFGLFTFSGFLETRGHSVSETGSISVLR